MIMFPKGIAEGDNFCNRDRQRAMLKKRVLLGVHTLINGQRRIGKTSFVRQVLSELKKENANEPTKIAVIEVDAFVCQNSQEFRQSIIHAIEQSLDQMLPPTALAIRRFKDFFQHRALEFSINKLGVKFKLGQSHLESGKLLTALQALDEMAHSLDFRVAFAIDEFQQIAALRDRQLEAVFRTVGQNSKALSFIFTGSNRRLLSNIFDDTSRPLYRLFAREEIERIKNKHYIPFITKASDERWGKKIDGAIAKRIMEVTSGFPYAVNSLCGLLWMSAKPPTLSDVDQYWRMIVKEEQFNSKNDFTALPKLQKMVLFAISQGQYHNGQNLPASLEKKMSQRHFNESLDALISKDFIYMDQKGCWKISDPITDHLLQNTHKKKPKAPPRPLASQLTN